MKQTIFGVCTFLWTTVICVGSLSCDSKKPLTTPDSESSKKVKEVQVAAASDLKFAMEDIRQRFQKDHPDIQVSVTYGSSGQFYSQLQNQAPYDLLFSADIEYPRRLIESGQALPETLFEYAIGQIVVWVRKDSPQSKYSNGKEVLVDPQVTRIAIANPKHAPYGRAAEAALKTMGVYEQVKDRLVYGENIAQTGVFVESGNAQAGILALSLALAPQMREKGRFWEIPAESYPPIHQGGVILKWVRHRDAVETFRQFVISPQGREILEEYGFVMPYK